MIDILINATPSERKVLALATLGKSKSQIADETGMTVKSVNTFFLRMRKKNNVSNDYQLITKATQHTGVLYV